MAYASGGSNTPTSVQDLVYRLKEFASGLSTKPWTVDEYDTTNRRCTIHRTDGSGTSEQKCYVTFRWDNTTQYMLSIYQSLGFTSSTLPHAQPDDSGGGDTTSPPTTGRRVSFTDGTVGSTLTGPFQGYYFFAGEGSTPYIHVVVQPVTGLYRHFGFGNLAKNGTWKGGEYCYGHSWNQSTNYIDLPTYNGHQFMLDSGSTGSYTGYHTMHLEGFSEQAVNGKWGAFCGLTDSPSNDRQSTPVARVRLCGTARGGGYATLLGWVRASSLNSHKLILPITTYLVDTSTAPDTYRLLGTMPDVGIINVGNLSSGDEITVGSDTYKVFPWVRKQYTAGGAGNTEESWNGGVAYKKVV